MDQKQAFALLDTEFLLNPERFAHISIAGINLTAAGEFLIDEHEVDDDDAYQWAYDWDELRTSADSTFGINQFDS